MHLEAAYTPPRSWRTWLIGRPLATADAPNQTIGRLVGLAVFASDGLSSTAYATQEILVILAAVGTSAFGLVFPISLAIATLLAIVAISYEQTIHAYPGGGGAYIVSRDNLGELPAHIHHHYKDLAGYLSLENYRAAPDVSPRHRVILPIGGVHQGTLIALRYACSLSRDVTAVHVSTDPDEVERIQNKWELWGQGVRLVILDSPYRLFVEPLLAYVERVAAQRQPNELITIVVPQFVPKRWWHNLLHTHAAMMLRLALLTRPGITVTDVRYHLNGQPVPNGKDPHGMAREPGKGA